MLLCKEGELADGTYLDAATARSVRVEHVGARILSTEEAEEKARIPKVCVFTQQRADLACFFNGVLSHERACVLYT